MKEKNIQIAQRSLAIIREGLYPYESRTVRVKELVEHSVHNSFTLNPEESDKLLQETSVNKEYDTLIRVENSTTIEALQQLKGNEKTAILNFASAKNPGGGFLGGAQSQEESLARASSLYSSLTKDESMYRFNRANSSFLYSDYMIYSPDVVFWMDDEGNLLPEPLLADVITSPAPNKGAMLQHQRTAEITEIGPVLRKRMLKVLKLAEQQEIDCLILGAWGCGVFRNEPAEVAELFREVISSHFDGSFREIIFAVYDRSKTQSCITAFNEVFNSKNIAP